MTAPVHTATRPVATQPVNQNNATQRSAATPANNASTLSSAAPAQDSGVLAQIKNVVSKFFSGIRTCLSNIPFIGGLFRAGAPSTTQPAPSAPVMTDAERLAQVKHDLVLNGGATTRVAPALDQAAIDHIVGLFADITDPVVKADAFHHVLNSVNSTDAMAKSCLEALPEDMRNAFAEQCYIANGRSDMFNGHDHQGGVGAHIAYEATRSPVAITAAANYLAALRAPTATTVTAPAVSPRNQLRNVLNALDDARHLSADATVVAAALADAQAAFARLDAGLKDAVKGEIYVANGNSDNFAGASRANNYGTHGFGVGAYVVSNALTDNVVKEAVRACLDRLYYNGSI